MLGVPYYNCSIRGPKTLFQLLRPLCYDSAGLSPARPQGGGRAGVSENWGNLRVPLKGYYKGTIRVALKGSIRV